MTIGCVSSDGAAGCRVDAANWINRWEVEGGRWGARGGRVTRGVTTPGALTGWRQGSYPNIRTRGAPRWALPVVRAAAASGLPCNGIAGEATHTMTISMPIGDRRHSVGPAA